MKLMIFKIIFILNIVKTLVIGQQYRAKFKTVCGQPSTMGRIVGGTDAAIGEFPWMTRIGLKQTFYTMYMCGGSLITDRHVLTAEHCIHDVVTDKQTRSLIVSLGDTNKYGTKACMGKLCSDTPVQYKVKEIIPYALDSSNFKNDITLFVLARSVEFTRFISPICLPENISPAKLIGESAVTIGFGLVNSRKRVEANILQKITIQIKDIRECYMFAERPGSGQFCAGSKNKDSCDGDSGGPLFKLIKLKNEPRFVLLGIVSFGSTRCENEVPAVYVDVNYYLKWIDRYLDMSL